MLSGKKDNTSNRKEKLRKKEIRGNENNDISDVFDNSRIGDFYVDMVGVLGWKGTGILVILIIVGFIAFQLIFN